MTIKSNLIFSQQENEDGKLFIIKDPDSDRFFRFKEIETFIARQFNGNTPLETISERVADTFQVTLSQENLIQFSNRLQNIGLLIDEQTISGSAGKKRWKLNGDIFYLRGKLFNPDRFFDWLLPKIWFLFTPGFIIASASLVLISVGITVTHWNAVMHEFYNAFRFEFIVQAYLVMLGVVTLHEFAHGLTCKHFGGHVREIGFMLIYFQPAFYCNVSDAWLFPEKSQRMWVTFAGAYFEIFLWALATLVWRVTDTGTSIHYLALIITATSAFKMFFNMNPLIKLDGYYLLCDWIDIPNLRQKASNYFNGCIKKLVGYANHATTVEINPRLKVFFVLYSILSTLYIYWILYHIISWFAGLMIDRYQATGFIIFTLLFAVFFRNQINSVVAPLTSGTQTFFQGISKRIKVPRFLKWIVILLGMLAALYFVRAQLKISGSFVVLPHHNADMRAEAEGIIEEIFVEEGDKIPKGTRIARIADHDYIADLKKTQAEIESKEADLRLLQSGAKPEEIELLNGQVSKAQELVQLAQSKTNRDKQLVEQKFISIAEFEASREQQTVREKELQEVQGKLKLLKSGSRQEEIEASQASIRALQAHEQFIQEQLQQLDIVSSIDGVVTTHKLKEKVGENVKKGDLVAEVYAMNIVTVEIAVPEKEIGDVKVGQDVVLKARAHPGETFWGKVIKIAPVATKSAEEWNPDRTILVTTQLDNARGLLKPEMTGNGKIYCGEHRLADLLSRRMVRYFKVEFWSMW
ncbi:MAG TPA: HlyD family efflux transporter periplasmic adaptor subunit [Cyclobacteriaceae bacterium]|nr:HlyD family efflux transporter periplasmic adaptor subunit [Cyclobacteriaceae bacterium]